MMRSRSQHVQSGGFNYQLFDHNPKSLPSNHHLLVEKLSFATSCLQLKLSFATIIVAKDTF
jgi:hypothetical protein